MRPAWSEREAKVPSTGRPSLALTVGATILAAAMLVSVAAALVTGRPWELRELPAFTRVELADTGVSVELPGAPVAGPAVESEGVQIFTFGTLATDPLVVQVGINVLPEAVAPDELDAVMAKELEGAQQTEVPGAVRDGDATMVKLGGRPYATVAHHMGAIPVRSWVSVFGDREVYVRISAAPDLPSAWSGQGDRIVESLKAR